MKFNLTYLLLLVAVWAMGQSNVQVASYSMTIKGTSNLHPWESKVNEVRANGSVTIDKGVLKSIQSLYVEIPVKTIKSSKGSIMDNKTYEALRADNHPNITFNLEKVTDLSKSGDGYDVYTSGYLTISGATNKVDIFARGRMGADGSLAFSGSKKLKMTDYKIKPPTALMGTLTTGDEVEIVFQVTLK